MTTLSKTIVFAILLVNTYNIGSAQTIQWEENYGSTNSDNLYSMKKTSKGGFILAGYSDSSNRDVPGGRDCLIIKLDESRNIQWEQNYGGSNDDHIQSIQQTNDGGYVFAASSKSSDGDVSGNYGNSDYWIVKLDESGNIEWENHYGGSYEDQANSIQQTNDSGYIVAGNSSSSGGDVSGNKGYSDYWVMKLDQSGKIQWEQNYGGSYIDDAAAIQQTEDGGYAVFGSTGSITGDVSNNHGGRDFWLLKLNESGNIEWKDHYGGKRSDNASDFQQTSDGGYILCGNSSYASNDVSENKGSTDYWILKVNNSGNIEWEESYGGSEMELAGSIQQTSYGGYIVTGASQSSDGDVSGNHGSYDYWILKLTEFGNLQWEQNYGGSNFDYSSSVLQTSNGDYLVAGGSGSDDKDVSANNGNSDYWLLKLSNPTSIQSRGKAKGKINLYPNPASEKITINTTQQTKPINYTLFNATGQKVIRGAFTNQSSKTMDVRDLSPGVYFLQIQLEEGLINKKVIVE